MKIELNNIVKRTPEMVFSKLDGEVVMMSVENGEYYGLNEIGSAIWERISDEIKVDDLVVQLMEEYDVERAECEADTIEFLEEMAEKKLVVVF
ncbi:MAG: lasso peptide biosynthesis PqqD family chaperone [Bacteroidales bacterium]|nr:lasso peptide biosynthesis PqqD family chaperone [Bacteroidales bacterium]